MEEQFQRTEMLLGEPALLRLQHAHVALFGLGGVGGYAAEALARAGIGRLTLVDKDTISCSNINRQILALHSTVGMLKIDAAKARILDIYPGAKVYTYPIFYQADTADQFAMQDFDYVLDAIDTVSAKLLLAQRAIAAGTPIISCMGTGNKLDPSQFCVTDLSKTSMCPLARVMRRNLGKPERNPTHEGCVFPRSSHSPQWMGGGSCGLGKKTNSREYFLCSRCSRAASCRGGNSRSGKRPQLKQMTCSVERIRRAGHIQYFLFDAFCSGKQWAFRKLRFRRRNA